MGDRSKWFPPRSKKSTTTFCRITVWIWHRLYMAIFFHPSSHPPFSPHMKTFGTTFCRIEVRILRTLYMAIFFFHWIHPSLLSPYKIQNTSNTYNDHNQASNNTYICPLLHFDSIGVTPCRHRQSHPFFFWFDYTCNTSKSTYTLYHQIDTHQGRLNEKDRECKSASIT